MKFDTYSYRHGLELTQNIPELNQLWNEIQDSLLKIDDNILINHFEAKGKKRGKSMSDDVNELLKCSLIKKGWQEEAKIFNEYPYDSKEGGMKYFRLDFAKKIKIKLYRLRFLLIIEKHYLGIY